MRDNDNDPVGLLPDAPAIGPEWWRKPTPLPVHYSTVTRPGRAYMRRLNLQLARAISGERKRRARAEVGR